MNYILHTQKITLSDLEQDAIDKKLSRLNKLLTPPFVIHVTLEHDTHHQRGDVVNCKLNIEHGKRVYHAERDAATVADVVDEVIHAIKQELVQDRDKEVSARRASKSLGEMAEDEEGE